MALLTALLTSAAVTSLVTWNDVIENRSTASYAVSDDVTGAFDVTTPADTGSHPTSNAADFRSPTTTSEDYFRLRRTTRGPFDHLRSQRLAITRSIRLYGIIVAACVSTVLAVALAAACVVVRGGQSTSGRWGSCFRRFRPNRRSAADLPTTTSGVDGDYIYRPLGTGTGNRFDDEYETTFVGVSVPLLHDVGAV